MALSCALAEATQTYEHRRKSLVKFLLTWRSAWAHCIHAGQVTMDSHSTLAGTAMPRFGSSAKVVVTAFNRQA